MSSLTKMCLGAAWGKAVKQLAESEGVEVIGKSQVKELKGKHGKVNAVLLEDGRELPAQAVMCGVGVRRRFPAFEGSVQPQITKDGGINCSDKMEIAPDFYVAGDIAHYPWWYTGKRIRVEHWVMQYTVHTPRWLSLFTVCPTGGSPAAGEGCSTEHGKR